MMSARNTLEDIYRIFDSIVPDEYGCHQWPTAVVGYYRTATISGRGFKVHRLALERKLGRPIRPGYEALHTCDCKSCVNEDHLYEGTKKDNNYDMRERNLNYQEYLQSSAWKEHLRRNGSISGKLRTSKQMAHSKGLSKIRWAKHRNSVETHT
jgi:hypothetical protein